jgi:hypothetical protein
LLFTLPSGCKRRYFWLRYYHADCEQTWSISTRFEDALSCSPTYSIQRLPLSLVLSRQFAIRKDDVFARCSIRSETRTTRSAVPHTASLSSLVCTGNKTQKTHRLLLIHARPFLPCSTTSASHPRTSIQDRHAFATPSFNERVHSPEPRITHIHTSSSHEDLRQFPCHQNA